MAECPVSLFDSVKSNQPTDCEQMDFEDFVGLMYSFASEEYAGKADAPLICLTQFEGNLRRKSNATGSSMVVLDIDDHLSIADVDRTIRDAGVAALLCSTASHRPEHHKFRVYVPLSEGADYDQHVLAWHAVNLVLANGMADPSKIGCESMFYVPGLYPNAPTEFEHYVGWAQSAAEWIELVGGEDEVLAFAGKDAPARTTIAKPPAKQPTKSPTHLTDADLGLSRTRLVTDKALDAYRNPTGSYHHARFALLLSMAGRARRMNVNCGNDDLLMIFNQIDQEDGGHYQSPEHQKALLVEAQKAISS